MPFSRGAIIRKCYFIVFFNKQEAIICICKMHYFVKFPYLVEYIYLNISVISVKDYCDM